MKLLSLKAAIYRYTGIYLASRDELDYITSKDFWMEFTRIINHPENDMAPRDIQGLLIGSWQAKYRFARPITFSVSRTSPWHLRLLASLGNSFISIKRDIQRLFKRTKSKGDKCLTL